MDSVFGRALHGIAGAMQVLAFETDASRVYEADLRAATRRAIQTHLANIVVPEASVPLVAWPRVGTFDIAVRTVRGKGFEALAELKWWQEAGKITESLWDVWKLATAYKAGLAPFTYVIAGGSLPLWESSHPFTSFWTDASWSSADLWTAHGGTASGFPPGKGPTEFPAGIRASLIARVPIHLDGQAPWELRCARITTTPGRPFKRPDERDQVLQ